MTSRVLLRKRVLYRCAATAAQLTDSWRSHFQVLNNNMPVLFNLSESILSQS